MDPSTLLTILTALGGAIGGILGAPLAQKIFERLANAGERRGDELAEIRRDQAAALKACREDCERKDREIDQWQERYYAEHEGRILAERDVRYYQRMFRVSTSAADRAELVARDVLDRLPAPPSDAEGV